MRKISRLWDDRGSNIAYVANIADIACSVVGSLRWRLRKGDWLDGYEKQHKDTND